MSPSHPPLPWLCLLTLTGALTAGCETTPPAPSSPSRAPQAHVLLVLRHSDRGLEVLQARRVEAALPTRRGKAPEERLALVVEGADGRVLHQAAVDAPGGLRGEFHGPGGQIEAVHLERPTRVFTVRVPPLSGGLSLKLLERDASPVEASAAGTSPARFRELAATACPKVLR